MVAGVAGTSCRRATLFTVGPGISASAAIRAHLSDYMAAYNFARRLKTLNGLTAYEYICRIWTSEPDGFIVSPIHQMPGLHT